MDEILINSAIAFVIGYTDSWDRYFPGYMKPSNEECLKMHGSKLRENVIKYLENNKIAK